MQREVLMLRVRNAHSAKLCGVLPGAVGKVDANNPGVRVALASKRLVPVEGEGPEGEGPEGEAPRDAVVNPAEHLAALDEIKRLRVALDHERVSAAAHIADMERELAHARDLLAHDDVKRPKKGS